MTSIPKNLIPVNDFNEQNIGFTEPKMKDNRFNAYVINPELTDGTNLHLKTDPILTSYGLSEYLAQGAKQPVYSITVKNKSFNDEYNQSSDNLFDQCHKLNDKMKKFFLDKVSGLVLNKKDAAKVVKNPKLGEAYVTNIIKQDKNGDDEIKFKIRADKNNKPMDLVYLHIEKYEMIDNKKVVLEKNKINLSDYQDPWIILKENIKPGSHIQAVIKPNIYWYGNRFGISFHIEALSVSKSNVTTVDIKACNLTNSLIGFSIPKKNKDPSKGFSALVLNNEKKSLFGKIETGWIKLPYGISSY